MTENGWPPDTDRAPFVSIPLSQCVQVTIPGTTETLWFQKGAPAVILPAFMAAMNEHVEPLLNSQGYNDEGTWTNGNSVGTSNHLGATALDYNWTDHPMGPAPEDPRAGWQGSSLINGNQVPAIRELLDFCEGTVFWGGDWDTPKDSMHFQMGYDTYDPAKGGAADWVEDFMRRKIGPDGRLTWRPSWLTPEPAPAPPRPDPVAVLARAAGLTAAKAAEVLPTLSAGLALAQCRTVNRVAMFIAQTRHESDQYRTTVEYGTGQRYAPYIGRTWIQVTWQSNYAAFGRWAAAQGLIADPDQFVRDPASLAELRWASIGAAWYWITPHPGHNLINDDTDRGDVTAVTHTINGGENGLAERIAYWNQARAVGADLLVLVNTDTDTTGDGLLSALNADEQREVLELCRQQAKYRRASRSRLRWPHQGDVDTCAGFAWNADAFGHEGSVERLATEYGDSWAIANLYAVINTDEPDRAGDIELAKRILAKVPQAYIEAAHQDIKAWLDAAAAYNAQEASS